MITTRGISLAVALVALFILGVVTHYVELGVLFVAGAATLLFGLGWVLRRPKLRIERQIEPDRVVRGEVALGLLKVGNQSTLTSSPMVAYEATGSTKVTVDIPRLASGDATNVTYRLPTARRAVVPVGPLSVTKQDPFGLWRITQTVGDVRQLWVHPVTHALSGLPSGRSRSLDGPDDERALNGSITFHSLREYVAGDDLRRVHWRSSARLGTLMVREHVDTSLAQITLVLDTSKDSYGGDGFEAAVEAAASIAVAATSERYAVRVLTTGGQGALGRGISADRTMLLDCFAGLEPGDVGSLGEVADGLARERRGDVLVVVTGRPKPDHMRRIVALGRRYDAGVMAIVAPDADGVDCPTLPNIVVVRAPDSEEFAAMWNAMAPR